MSGIKITPADKAFSDYIRTRDNWTCQRCGGYYDPLISTKRMGLHCSHFKGRGKESTRFEPLNADALCYGCHRYFTAMPDEHYMWQVSRKGQDVVDRVILASNGYKKKSERPLEAKYWREELKKLEERNKTRPANT